jgi:Protein of unknown function (DUF3105)
VVAVLAAGAAITAVLLTASKDAAPTASANLAAVQTFPEERNHVQGKVNYPQTPPAGGNHNAIWLNCGIYTTPVPNENAVHDLEHGAVWITYRPDLSSSDVSKLTAFARHTIGADLDPHLLLSPYPGLPAPVVASAWGKQLRLTGASDPRLPLFVKTYVKGPQTPEPGAKCSGGVGTPNG